MNCIDASIMINIIAKFVHLQHLCNYDMLPKGRLKQNIVFCCVLVLIKIVAMCETGLSKGYRRDW